MKQFLLMCDETGIDSLRTIFKPEIIQFLEVQGMVMQSNQHNILLTPIIPPVSQAVMAPVDNNEAVVTDAAPTA